jgi:hypothetical protein
METTTYPKPLLVKKWAKVLRERPSRRAREELLLQMQEFALPKEYRKGAQVGVDRRSGRVRLSVRTRMVGRHFFPPNIESITLSTRRRVDLNAMNTEGRVHNHLGVSV